jgi:hypothetical protein
LYDVIADVIRPNDVSHLILFEPATWGMIFYGNLNGEVKKDDAVGAMLVFPMLVFPMLVFRRHVQDWFGNQFVVTVFRDSMSNKREEERELSMSNLNYCNH